MSKLVKSISSKIPVLIEGNSLFDFGNILIILFLYSLKAETSGI